MAIVLLILTLCAFAAFGYWRGGLRLGLALLPLLLASILLWLLAAPVYEITIHQEIGLVWPAVVIGLVGLAGGYTARYLIARKLSSVRKLPDRIAGLVLGALIGLVTFELGLIYLNVRDAAANEGQVAVGRTRLARSLNDSVVRWIPGVGAGSSAMTNLMEIAAAPPHVREQAIRDLEIDHLADLPAMQNVINDPETAADIEAAAAGDLRALYRLQKNQFVLALGDDDEFMEAARRISLDAIAQAVRDARSAEAPGTTR